MIQIPVVVRAVMQASHKKRIADVGWAWSVCLVKVVGCGKMVQVGRQLWVKCRSRSSVVMADRWSFLAFACVVGIVLLASCLQCGAEIHRAKSAVGSRPHRPSGAHYRHRRGVVQQEAAWRGPARLLSAVKSWVWSLTSIERVEIWACSVIASAVVGLSGIFPLLVIPLEAGEALRRGGECQVYVMHKYKSQGNW